MKNSIIEAITNAMQRELDYKQMTRLKEVLYCELSKVDLSEHKDNEAEMELENTNLLDSFISAKKIEGCSDKTLLYYRNTIDKMLLVVNMAICHIETRNIRDYLSMYQETNNSSKVTIDNMRRIFSSFFASSSINLVTGIPVHLETTRATSSSSISSFKIRRFV